MKIASPIQNELLANGTAADAFRRAKRRPRDPSAWFLISLVQLYRYFFSPMLRFLVGTSGSCRYSPSCSCYAIESFQRHGTIRGSRLTISRLLRCHPWGAAGHDPVPAFYGFSETPRLSKAGAEGKLD